MAVTRRKLLTAAGAGGALAALGTVGIGAAAGDPHEAMALQACREFLLGPGGRKPVVLPAEGSMDPADHSRSDVLFWSEQMMEHALFTAHLLDPRELPLIAQATAMAASFQALAGSGDAAGLAAAGELILNFKETAEAGIEAGQIQSIIHPALADHIRREAVKFRDELARAMA